jgi:hypothetical protein
MSFTKLNIKSKLFIPPSGCEAPTQAHKAHQQTLEAPAQHTRGFSPNENYNVMPTKIPTSPTPRPLVGMPPKDTKHQQLERSKNNANGLLNETIKSSEKI